ncbi:MAG: hypothetical protein KA010_01750 [Saprospiraceae bacterium]|nr:hypothetical protein [Saprospiraceae bacterium]
MEFKKGYSVLKFDGKSRSVSPFIKTDKETDLIDIGINPCDYAYCNLIINELNSLNSNKNFEYEWGGGERVCFTSTSVNTLVIDNFGWSKGIEVPTNELLELVINKNMISENSNIEKIKDLITLAFIEIKLEPQKFHIDNNFNYYTIRNWFNGLDVTITLEECDFNVEECAFRNSLFFSMKYFPQGNLPSNCCI